MGALSDIVRQGKALYVGISNYQADEASRAIAILKANGTPCLIHQPRYNMFERWVEDGLLGVLDRGGVGCICFSPLAQGALTGRYLNGIPEGSRASKMCIRDRHSTNFPGMELIRPLYFVKEGDILAWKDYNGLHFLQCACRFTEQIARDMEARGAAKASADVVHLSLIHILVWLLARFRQSNPARFKADAFSASA